MADVNDIIKLVVGYSQPNASAILNVFYWLVTNAADDGDVLIDMVDWVETIWGADWDDEAPDSCSIVSVGVDIVSALGTVVKNLGNEVVAIAGLQSDEPLPPSNALSIFADTALPKTRGRKFVPCIADGSITSGVVNATGLAWLATLLADYVSDYSATGDYQPGVLSVPGEAFVPFVTAGGFDTIVDMQSRRRADRGN